MTNIFDCKQNLTYFRGRSRWKQETKNNNNSETGENFFNFNLYNHCEYE